MRGRIGKGVTAENVTHSARGGQRFHQPDRTAEHPSSGSLRPSASVHYGRTDTSCRELTELELSEPEQVDPMAARARLRYGLTTYRPWIGRIMVINEGTWH